MTGYTHLLPIQDAPLVKVMSEVARQHNSWGYRLVQGWVKGRVEGASLGRVRRLWKQHGLARLTRKARPKLRTGARLKPLPTGPNAIWCMDFAEDRLIDGAKLFAFLVKDEATAFGLEIATASSFKGKDVEAILDRLILTYGVPEFIRCDNGGQFIAFVVQQWAEANGIKMAHIDPGKPWQNGSAESFAWDIVHRQLPIYRRNKQCDFLNLNPDRENRSNQCS